MSCYTGSSLIHTLHTTPRGHVEFSMVSHAYNFSTQDADAEGLEFKTSLSYTVRPCLKNSVRGHVELFTYSV
jgi:hypothetical protein